MTYSNHHPNQIDEKLYIFNQINDLMCNLNDEVMTSSLDILHHATIGQHLRHIADFYLCILNGMNHGVIDYSARARNPLLEQSASFYQNTMSDIHNIVSTLVWDTPISIIPDIAFTNGHCVTVQSSIGRELMYAFDHALHHLAIIKIGLKTNFPTIHISDSLGVAPSTIRHKTSHLPS